MKTLIQKLVESVGPSGFEKSVRELIRSEIEGFADEVRVDALGNLIARKGKRAEGGLRILLSAHMDEIGLIVTHIDEKGFIRFTNIGGVYPHSCYGSRVKFVNGVEGLIGMEKLESIEKMPGLPKMFIDVGATSRSDCPVKVGDMAVFDRPLTQFGSRLVSKAMDDRIACAIQVETLRRLKDVAGPNELYFVFSVQEEVGPRGAGPAAFGIDPDLGIAVDVTLTGDTPQGTKMEVALGKGPAIKVKDSGMIADPRVVAAMTAAAERAGIPHQYEVLVGGTTDAIAIQVSRAGVPTGCLSVPCRYVHSPSEMVDLQDVQQSVDLLVELLSKTVKLEG